MRQGLSVDRGAHGPQCLTERDESNPPRNQYRVEADVCLLTEGGKNHALSEYGEIPPGSKGTVRVRGITGVPGRSAVLPSTTG